MRERVKDQQSLDSKIVHFIDIIPFHSLILPLSFLVAAVRAEVALQLTERA